MKKFVCPVCRSPRKAMLADRLSIQLHLQMLIGIGVVAGVIFLASGMTMALRALFFYLPLWGVLEFIHGVRVREAAKCPTCAFDPVLYKRDWKAARAKIERKLGGEMETYLKDFEQRRARVSKNAVVGADIGDNEPVAATEKPKKEVQSSLF